MSENEGHEHGKTFTIIVNGQEKTVTDHTVSYAEVVQLAFPEMTGNPDVIFNVTYRKSDNEHKPAGTLSEGQDVKVKDGTIFDVTPTTKS